jgi:hypothetical protein
MSGAGAKNYKQLGEDAWKRADKVNGELFALTYGALVAQMLRDYEDATQVNVALDKLGYSLGIRLIDEFLARTSLRCSEWREVGEVLRVAFRQFLNLQPSLIVSDKELTLSLSEDGLGGEFVELPEMALKGGLHYSNVLCGVIRGALEMVGMQVEATITADPLLTPSVTATDIRVKLVKYLEEERPPGDD